MEIICGTYEELIISFKLVKAGKEYSFATSFTDHSHSGNVKAVAVSSNGILATGSSDESIRLFSLTKRKELGTLLHHEGAISCLEFYGRHHLLSGSEDGTISIWKVGSWECLRNLRGHKDAVYDVSVHPSGKIALSISKDKSMRTWNLITGKRAFITNIKSVADHIFWMPNGDRYLIVTDRRMDIYGVQSGKIEETVLHDKRIHAVSFIEEGTMAVAGEGGDVFLYNTEDYSKQYEFSTETNRVKGLYCCESEDDAAQLITGSADGNIKLWRMASVQGKWSHQLIASINCNFRITSMAVHMPQLTDSAKKVEKVENTEDNEVEDSDVDEESEDESEDEIKLQEEMKKAIEIATKKQVKANSKGESCKTKKQSSRLDKLKRKKPAKKGGNKKKTKH